MIGFTSPETHLKTKEGDLMKSKTKLPMLLVLTTLIFSGAVVTHAGTISGQETRRIDRRENRQARRIRQGRRSGSLTRREARRLSAQQARIRRHERRVKSDGVVTSRERHSLRRQERRASRRIYGSKHNRRHR